MQARFPMYRTPGGYYVFVYAGGSVGYIISSSPPGGIPPTLYATGTTVVTDPWGVGLGTAPAGTVTG